MSRLCTKAAMATYTLHHIIAVTKEKIVILSTHIVSDVAYIADTILLMKQGRFLLQEPMNTVAESIKGKVWEISVSQQEADKLNQSFCVVSLRHENGAVRLRIVHDTAPTTDAVTIEPSLEDLYLYHFQDQISERSGDYVS